MALVYTAMDIGGKLIVQLLGKKDPENTVTSPLHLLKLTHFFL